MIEYVSRRPASAITDGDDVRAGSRARRIALARSPRATAASTKPRTDCSSVAVRTMRAISGACTIATAATSAPLLGARAGHEHEDEEQRRDATRARPRRASARRRRGPAGSRRRARSRRRRRRRAASRGPPARARCARPRACARARRGRARRCRAARRRRARRTGGRSTREGECGAKYGPTSATSRTNASSATPTAPLRACARSGSGLIAPPSAASARAARTSRSATMLSG